MHYDKSVIRSGRCVAVDAIGVGRDGEGTRFDIYIDCDAVGKGSGNIVCSLVTAVFTLTLLLARPLVLNFPSPTSAVCLLNASRDVIRSEHILVGERSEPPRSK